MKYSDFFPSYPTLENYKNIYNELYQKKEFYDLKGIGELNDFRNYQLIPARFLSPWTFYQRLLLIHDTGTGKSASICAALDLLKKHDSEMTFIYLTSNDTLVKNFKGYKNTKGIWENGLIQRHCAWIKDKLKREDWTNINSFYRRYSMFFSTFGSFKRDLEKISSGKLHKVFLVLDEAHHLVTKNVKDKKSNYSFLMDFIENRRELKLLVSTATPMRDDALELIYLLNLVVPFPFPTDKKFFNQYLTITNEKKNNDLNVYHFQPNKDKQFRSKLAGYVSVVRQKIKNVHPQYMGNVLKGMESTFIYVDRMDTYQERIYLNSWEKGEVDNDDEDNKNPEESDNNLQLDSLYNNSIQASLMVFPSLEPNENENEIFKPYGRFAAKKFVSTKNVDKNSFNNLFFELTGLIQSPQDQKDMKKNLEIIKRYSVIYHDIIINILRAKKTGKCIYVYSEKINGSGILRCIYLLKQCFNFQIVDSKKSILNYNALTEKDRLIFLSEDDIQELVGMFNNPKNKHGNYFRVIFGTDKTTEGITLNNIQEIHITTPGWNFGKKNQAEGRGIRIGTHTELLEELKENNKTSSHKVTEEINVEIYLHCAVPSNLDHSVNYLQYVRSEIKERNIYLFQYQMLLAAVDCQLNYEQNFRANAVDNSAECYFQKCEYNCDGIDKIDLDDNDIKKGNFNTYFLDANKKIIQEISALYSYNNIPRTFHEIKMSLENSHHYSDFQIYYTINTMIDTPIMISLDNGNKHFLIQQNGYVFTSPTRDITLWQNESPCLESTSIQPRFSILENTHSLLTKMYLQEDFLQEKMSLFQKMLNDNDISNMIHFFQSFPSFVQDYIISLYPRLNILQTAEYNENTKKLKFKLKDKPKEIDFNNNRVENTDTNILQLEKKLENNIYKFYAIQSGKTFKIRDVSDPRMLVNTKTKTKGQDITTIKVFQLIYYISILVPSICDEYEKMVPKTFSNRLKLFKEMSQDTIEKDFEEYKNEFPIFQQRDYSFEGKKLVVFLKELFSSKKTILIHILKEEVMRKNLVLQL
jgi:hypothetical protein